MPKWHLFTGTGLLLLHYSTKPKSIFALITPAVSSPPAESFLFFLKATSVLATALALVGAGLAW